SAPAGEFAGAARAALAGGGNARSDGAGERDGFVSGGGRDGRISVDREEIRGAVADACGDGGRAGAGERSQILLRAAAAERGAASSGSGDGELSERAFDVFGGGVPDAGDASS